MEPNAKIGSITWIEIPAVDIQRVQKFYGAIFNWTFTPHPPPEPGCEPSYVLFSKGTTHGGFAKLAPQNHLSPAKHPDNAAKEKRAVTVTISVESVDDTLKVIERAGGKVYQ
jgi:predicted enzyme related to lactoylglutathione lyase